MGGGAAGGVGQHGGLGQHGGWGSMGGGVAWGAAWGSGGMGVGRHGGWGTSVSIVQEWEWHLYLAELQAIAEFHNYYYTPGRGKIVPRNVI